MSTRNTLTTAAVSLLALTGTVAAPALASAQNSSVPVAAPSAMTPHGSQDMGQAPDGGLNGAPPPSMADHSSDRVMNRAAPGYAAVPPAPPAGYDRSHATRPEDRAYARAYARWAQERQAWDFEHCAQKHRTGAVIGSIVGGIAGAVIGSNAAPRWDRSGGTVAGGALGAIAGGALGSTTGGACPPPPYAYGPGPGYGPGPLVGPAYYGPGYYGPAYYGPGFYGPRVVVGGPFVSYRVGPRWGWRHAYWRRW